MRLTVIIVSYQVRHYLAQCLDSLRKSIGDIPAEVIVVDNHSADDSVAFVRQHHPWVRIIANNHNLGFARANNIAIRKAQGDYVLLLNPDTVVGENTLADCLSFMDAHPDAGALGVCMLNSDGTRANESRRGVPTPMTAFYKMSGLCCLYPESRRFGRYYMGWLPWDKPAEIEIASGAFSVFRREVLQELGGFDEDYFMYGEDIDLSYRLLKKGLKNYYLPVNILHYKGESTHKSSFRYVHVFYEAMFIFLKKHFGHLSLLLSLPIKAAIYVKALGALIFMSIRRMRKVLGFPVRDLRKMPVFACVGSAAMIGSCRNLIDEYAYEGIYIEGDEQSLPEGHSSQIDQIVSRFPGRDIIVVYDTAAYSYQTILGLFCRHHRARVTVGFYNPQTNNIVSVDDVI